MKKKANSISRPRSIAYERYISPSNGVFKNEPKDDDDGDPDSDDYD